MGILDTLEKLMFEQKSEAEKEEQLKGIKVFDLPDEKHKFSWKTAIDLMKGKEVEKRPNRWHYKDIMLVQPDGNMNLVRVYKKQMSNEEALRNTEKFNKYMQSAVLGEKKEKKKEFSWSKFWEIIKNATDDEIKMARGKSKEFNAMVEQEEARRNAHNKTVDIEIGKRQGKDQDQVAITQVMRERPDGSIENLGKMYKREMTKQELDERKERGERWRELDEPEKKTYVRFENDKKGRSR